MDFSAPFSIDQWTVDPVAMELRDAHGNAVPGISGKPIGVLVLLAQRQGELVSAQQIIAAVWGENYQGESPVPNAISRLRKALQDDPNSPSFIQTISGRGYRLLGRASLAQAPTPTAAQPSAAGEGAGGPTDTSRYKHLAFICYSHHNEATAVWLAQQLRRASGPLPTTSIFIDTDTPRGSGSYRVMFRRELAASKYLVLCLSPSAGQAEFVAWETETFLQTAHASQVLLARVGDDEKGIQDPEVFPELVRPRAYTDNLSIADLRGEPARWSAQTKKGREQEVDGLLANMWGLASARGVRQRRRLVQIATALSAALALVALIAVVLHLLPKQPVTVGGVPFENALQLNDDELGKALVRDVLHHLSGVPKLNVVSPSVSFSQYANVELLELGKAISADYLIDGIVSEQGDAIQVTLALTDAKSGLVVQALDFSQPSTQRTRLTSQIAVAIADWLGFGTPLVSTARYIRPGTKSAEANLLYHAGIDLLKQTNERSNLQSAISSFEEALEYDGRYAEALAGSCEAHLRLYIVTREQALFDKATQRCNRALTLEPELPEARVAIGTVYREGGKLFESEQRLKSVLDEQPTNVDVMIELAETYAVAGRLDEAEALLREAVRLQPGYWEGYSALGYLLYGDRGNYQEALENFLWVIRLRPRSAIAHANAAGAYYLLGELDEARKMIDRSIEIEPLGFALITRGLIAYYERNFELAAESYEAALALDEEDFQTWGLLGEVSRLIPEREANADDAFRKALALAEESVNINDLDAVAIAKLGLYHARLGQFDAARAKFKEAHSRAPDDMDVHHLEAAAWAEEGNVAEVCASLAEAIALGFDEKSIRNDAEFEPYLQPCSLP